MRTLKQQLEGIYQKLEDINISETEEEKYYQQIRKLRQQDERAFLKALTLIDPEKDLTLSVIYEALVNEESSDWEKIGLIEIKRLLKYAETAQNPDAVIQQLWEMTMAEEVSPEFLSATFKMLIGYFYHSSDAMRHAVIKISDDFIDYLEEVNVRTDILERLRDKLNDKHWKIRVLSHQILKNNGALPTVFKLSFGDRLKSKISSFSDF